MSDLLYLDTARLGRMSPAAQAAHHDFVRLAAAEAGSARFDRFLARGADGLPHPTDYPGLGCWRGLEGLKASLRALAGAGPDQPVLLASRSARLMGIAARLFFGPCRNVLATDLGWPPYHDILGREARRAGRSVTLLPLREAILAGGIGEEEIVDRACRACRSSGCDGVFLTEVSHLGVRLPVERIVRGAEGPGGIRLAVVDGAQGFCHAGTGLPARRCDLYLAGTHKWLAAHHPMGFALYGRKRSRPLVEALLARLDASGELDDPLLALSQRMAAGVQDGWSETVALAPLFSAQGAVTDMVACGGPGLDGRLANARAVGGVLGEAGWRTREPAAGLRTGILLARPERTGTAVAAPSQLRERLCEQDVAATAYEDGIVRLSMPAEALREQDLRVVRQAFASVA